MSANHTRPEHIRIPLDAFERRMIQCSCGQWFNTAHRTALGIEHFANRVEDLGGHACCKELLLTHAGAVEVWEDFEALRTAAYRRDVQ